MKSAVPVTLLILAALAVAKEVYKVPNPMLMCVGGMYVFCSAIFWSVGVMRNKPAYTQIVSLLVGWSLVTASLLAAVYRSDKAGWMWFKLTGYNVTLAENLPDRVNVSAVDFVARYPFFSFDAQDSTRLILPGGQHDIDETMVIPPGLSVTIAPGAVLRFGVGCSLISYSPITARGTAEAPIIFTAQNEWRKWGVVAVVRAGKSFFEHARFEHGRQALINDINLPGTLSFVETEAEVRHCEFFNLEGKDGANANSGWVLFQNNKFRGCFKDGVDFDGGTGEISHNEFVNCGDEAIDRGEDSRVQIFDNSIVGAKDAPKSAANQPDMQRAEN
ncbi:MAG: right-handed parallel beta-helix repeat-containing protein [bacterium]